MQFVSPRNLILLASAALITIFVAMLATVVMAPGNSDASINEQSSGKALIGGPFTLTDHQGVTRTEQDLLGKHSILYFGFTYCPDACPTALGQMTAALDLLSPEQQQNIKPVFVTVDPERDTVAAIADYVGLFSDKMMGLTGTQEQIDQVKSVYRVYSQKAESDDTSDYLVDHSSYIYVMAPNGDYLKHFSHNDSAETMRKYLADILG